MNFFGHAWVAGWFSQQAPFILGSMVPDFASALRASPPTSTHPELEAGIRLHHATDRVFHDTAAFQDLEQGARAALATLGLSKGARRALAHVGVEFLIDEQLERRSPGWTGYELALRYGSGAACRSQLQWRSDGLDERFAALCSRLAAASRRSDTRQLVLRLVACLAGRPRLELQPEEVPLLEPWLTAARPQVSERLPELLGELARELDAPRSVSGESLEPHVLHAAS
jgi:hypothetical protein